MDRGKAKNMMGVSVEKSSATKTMMGKLTRRSNARSQMCKSTMSTARGMNATGALVPVIFNKKSADEQFLEMVGKQLTSYSWYHGIMPREEVVALLKEDGDYVVRKTTLKKETTYCVSTKADGEYKHLPILYQDGKWTLCGESQPRLNELLDQYEKKGAYVGKTGAILKRGIPRPEYYILHENVKMEKKLGNGAFGEVHIGTYTKDQKEIKVAIKTIKGKQGKEHTAKFVKEARLLRKLRHPNIVGTYGVAPQEEPIMMVIELAEQGELKSYLQKNQGKVAEMQLYTFVRDAARGMCYLSLSKIIHRDLAARNCLLGANLILKISDFGLSEASEEIRLTKLSKVPVKWLAPETLKEGVFSSKSDVWSFGVMIWEMFTFCKSDPFPTLTNGQAREKILSPDIPMEAPPNTPEVVKHLMNKCFIKNPQDRIDFVGVLRMVSPLERPPNPTDTAMEPSAV